MKKKSKFRDRKNENGKTNIEEVLFRVFNLRFSVLSLINKRHEYDKFIFTSRDKKQAVKNLAKSMNNICRNTKLYIEYKYGAKSHRENNSNEFAVDVTLPYKVTEGILAHSNHTKFSVRSSNSIKNSFVVFAILEG